MSIRIERWDEGRAPDAGELRQRMLVEGYRVFQWSDAPGTTYDAHAHAEDQSHWIISGALTLRVREDEYILSAGDRDFLPAHTEHSAFVPGDEPVVYLIGARD
ncbi:MAG TPA: cupin domain-containing protein [Pyrinomonadaceae bacterium]